MIKQTTEAWISNLNLSVVNQPGLVLAKTNTNRYEDIGRVEYGPGELDVQRERQPDIWRTRDTKREVNVKLTMRKEHELVLYVLRSY